MRPIGSSRDVETNSGGNEVGMMDLKGYFDNLAAAAINKKTVLEQLVDTNAQLTVTNEDLVAIVEKLSNDIKNLK